MAFSWVTRDEDGTPVSWNPELIKKNLGELAPKADKVVALFYGRLFAEHPELRELFPAEMSVQRDRLFEALTTIAAHLDDEASLRTYLHQMGRDHRKYAVLPEHYGAVGHALLAALRTYSAESWTGELAAAWWDAYSTSAKLMIEGAEADAAQEPAWWEAEVVSHERRTRDIAMLTLRTDPPLPYRAGQYVAVQTPRWPRVWRSYSIANAPGDDGLIELHVRAIPAGWVSSTLVLHTSAGDTLLVGPALGEMVLDLESERDLLCVAGSTGLAPIKALLEQLSQGTPRRGACVLVGARTSDELYNLADLSWLSATHPRIHVLTAVAAESSQSLRATIRQALDDATATLRNWPNHDVYVSGPDMMVNGVLGWLAEEGVGNERIYYDGFGDI